MCGFAGALKNREKPTGGDDFAKILEQMGMPLDHRGPDDKGLWCDPKAGAGLAHRRLSVIDLSTNARQPMTSSCGRYVLAYNGEIYNYPELRSKLIKTGRRFNGNGDTETLIEAISEWGLKKTLGDCIGMFAFALWDKKMRTLCLVRDRIGKKPLYYGWAGGDFIFGSELKALSAYPDFSGTIDRNALALFLRYSYVPAPCSIYTDIYKLMPGTILSISPEDIARRTSLEELNQRLDVFWSARGAVEKGMRQPFNGTQSEAEEVLADLLRDAVEKRMISDVPLGAMLSGGIDSSTVVSLMQASSTQPIKTFTVGFSDQALNESEYAGAVARHLGTDHTTLFASDREVHDVVPDMPKVYDEPFADSSQVPTYLISRLSRKHVTVALTGDGGDELFCGYRRYFRGSRIWKFNRSCPPCLRHGAAALLRSLPGSSERRPDKLAADMAAEDLCEMYINRISACRSPDRFLMRGAESSTGYQAIARGIDIPDAVHHMMFLDLINYLTDDILAKVDRASMAVSMELRNPILDHRVIEFAWQLPVSMKTDTRQGKLILKKMLQRYLPQALIDRPKQGFGAPTARWLAGPLLDWAEALLSEKRLKEEGFFEPEHIRRTWNAFLAGKGKYHHVLWNILMFQAWLENGKSL